MIAPVMMALASVYAAREEWSDAEKALEKAEEVFDANGFPEGQYAELYGQKAEVLLKTDRLEEAEAVCRRSIELFKKYYPAAQAKPNIAIGFQNLALVKAKAERWTEAEKLLQRAIELFLGTLGAEDPITITALVRLAALKLDQRNLEGAEALLGSLIDKVEQAKSNPRGAVTFLNYLSGMYFEREYFGEAEQLLRKCLRLYETPQNRAERVIRLSLQHDLSVALREKGEQQEADKLFAEVRGSVQAEKAPCPLAISRALRSVAAVVDEQENRYVLELELLRRHPLVKGARPYLEPGRVFLRVEFEQPGRPDQPLVQELPLTEQMVKGTLPGPLRFALVSPRIESGPLDQVHLVRIRAYSDPPSATAQDKPIAEHLQLVSRVTLASSGLASSSEQEQQQQYDANDDDLGDLDLDADLADFDLEDEEGEEPEHRFRARSSRRPPPARAARGRRVSVAAARRQAPASVELEEDGEADDDDDADDFLK
jgi:tetratricopeptide (TPR) repeat protein